MVSQEGKNFGALSFGQRGEDGRAPVLREVRDRICRVISAHPGQDVDNVFRALAGEQLRLAVIVEFFEDVSFKLGVSVHLGKEFSLLGRRRGLDEIRDLRRLQAAQSPERRTNEE